MKKLFWIIVFIPIVVYGQSIKWYSGSVVLVSKEVISGKFSLEDRFDLVLQNCDSLVNVISAHKIVQLNYFDTDQNINRRFTVIPQGDGVRKLFEIVVNGEIMILRKSICDQAPCDNASGYQYFVSYDGRVFSLFQFRENVFPAISKIQSLKNYIKREKLNPNLESDAVKIAMFYNRQANPNSSITPL